MNPTRQRVRECRGSNLKDRLPNWPEKPSPSPDGFVYTAPVGRFKPNAFGLYDMIGNAFQWCDDTFEQYSTDSATDPHHPSKKQTPRVFSAVVRARQACRVAVQRTATVTRLASGSISVGFRVVLESH